MTLDKLAELFAIFGVILPLGAFAWSAVTFVQIRQREVQRVRYQRFFEVLDNLGKDGGSVASKMGAVFELRKFPEYADVIIRLFDQVDVDGHSAPMLKDEMALTAEFLPKRAAI